MGDKEGTSVIPSTKRYINKKGQTGREGSVSVKAAFPQSKRGTKRRGGQDETG